MRPFLCLARVNKDDVVDAVYRGVAQFNVALHQGLASTQTGRVRAYALGIGLGAAAIVAILVFI